MNQTALDEIADRIRAELPSGALDPATIRDGATAPPTFVAELRKNPNWNALQAQLIEEAARLTWHLVVMAPNKDEPREAYLARLEGLRGEIRGMMRVLDGPAVALRAIEQRRER